MARIRTYALDNNVTGSDYWIGTDGNDNSNTKNFSPNSVAQYLNENEVVDVSNSIRFRYDTIDSGQQRKDGTMSFQNEIGATVPIEDLSSFILSKKTQSGKDVSFFLNVLPNTKVIFQKSNDINIFGIFRVLSVVTDFLEPDFFNVSLEFISGHGSIEEDKDYIISLIDLQKMVEVPQLVKETFNYTSSNTFTVANEINNVLQVIVNTTSLHPEAYSYTLPSTVTVINELFAGDVITVVYNYLEEFLEVPDLQRVTSVGNHTTNNIVLDNLPGENGDYTTINTLNDLGAFQSYTSPTNIDYQTEYAGYGMYINEIYSPTESKEMLIAQGFIQTSYTNEDTYNSILITSSDPAIEFGKNGFIGKLKSDNIEDNITLQFPAKPLGTYTIATTEDVPPFTPSDYDLDEFTNTNADPFAKISDIPAPLGYVPVNKAGDTMLGDLILNQDPSTALQAATKQYVDNIVTGINFHPPVVVATDVSLVATYDNGIDGVGATLTGPSVGVLMIDGETPAYLDRILVWQQADPIENGIYDLTTVGDSVTVYQLTRSSDADNSPPGEIHYGDYTLVLSGDTNGGFGFICNTPGTIDIGITPITYIQFNAAQAVTAGYGLQEAVSNVISIDPLVTQEKIILTTTGSGAATLVSNTLNIPTLPQATTSVSGYLSSTDWNTFNNKANVNTVIKTTITTSTYTLALTDANSVIPFSVSPNCVVTIPTNASVAFPIGTQIGIINYFNTLSFSITGVTLTGNVSLGTDDFVTILKTATDTWVLNGNSKYNISSRFSFTLSNPGINSGGFLYAGNGLMFSSNGLLFKSGISLTGNQFDFSPTYLSGTSGNLNVLNFSNTINPSSGTQTFTGLNLSPTINQTGGANGITRGLYINPTLTAAADFRAIEVTVGKVIVPTAANSNEAVNKGQVDNRLVLEKSGNYTLTNADSGGIIIFTASATLTIPTGLADGFECTFVTLSGVTLTVVSTGNTLNNATSTTMLPQLSFTLKRMLAANTYIVAGSL